MKYNFALTIGLCFIIAVLIIYSADAKQGALNGIYLCESIIIPSLLPILIITSILQKSKCSLFFEALFGKITERLFKLPKCCATAIIFGLIGGYPSGAILTNGLYQNGQITKSEAKRIMSFNLCGGIAFIITAVGSITLKSTLAGLIIYLTNIISSFLIMSITSAFAKRESHNVNYHTPLLSLTDAMIESVEQTAKSLIIMSVYIVLFSTFVSLIKLPSYIYPFIEITNGICNTKIIIPIEYCAFFLSFGGLCVHFQIINIIKEFDMKYFEFFIYRIFSGVLSFALAKLYFYVRPEDANVFSNLSVITPNTSQIKTGFGLIMIIGCVVLIYDIENRKISCRTPI